jgi:hypothetical protein
MSVQVSQGKINDSAGFKIIIDSKALDDMLRGPRGPVVMYMIKQADKVQTAAKKQCGYGAGNSEYGHLRDSIVKRIMANGSSDPIIQIGSSHPIALMHHDGTAAHVIFPSSASVLAFEADWSDGMVFAPMVNHPGTKPNHYLTDNLRLVQG